MKKKIVHLVYSFGYGGLEQVIVNLINSSQTYHAEHIIISLTKNNDLLTAIKPAIKFFILDKKPGKDISSHFKLLKLLKNIQADVLQTYNFATIEYHFIAYLAGIKSQVHCDHGRGGDDPAGKNKLNNLVRKFSAKFLDHYLVVSPDLYSWVKHTLNIKPPKLKLVYNGVDTKLYSPSTIQKNLYTLCTVGRAHEVKNQKLLINAYCQLRKTKENFKNTQLLIVGDGPLLNDLKKQAHQSGFENEIKLLGYRDDIPKIMAQSNLFLLTSLYEAMPMTILEAMSCGLPVISTNVGGVKHLISEENAWLVESNNLNMLSDTIYKLYSNLESTHTKAMLGQKMIHNNYSIETMVKSYMSFYTL